MEYSSEKSSSELPLNRMKENLKIIMNKKVAASARPIKLNGSLYCSKRVHYCVLWQRVKRGNFQLRFDETTNKNNILTENSSYLEKKNKKHQNKAFLHLKQKSP